jgi:hypothetical protein
MPDDPLAPPDSPFMPVHRPGTKPEDYLNELLRDPEMMQKAIEQASNFAFGGVTGKGLGPGKTLGWRWDAARPDPHLPPVKLTPEQRQWASTHDWFGHENPDGTITVKERWHDPGMGRSFEQPFIWNGTFQQLRDWAGY